MGTNSVIDKKQFLLEILTVSHSELLRLGLMKDKVAYTYSIGEEIKGWLALGTTVNEGPERVGINPTVGVLHEAIEKLVQEYCGMERSRQGATLTTNLGYVMPEKRFLIWVLEPSPFEWVHEVKKMVEAVEVYGMPFMRSNATLEKIIDNLEHHRYIDKDSAAYRLPVAYFLTGQTDRAKDYTREYLAELGERNDTAAQLYKNFASNLLREIHKQPAT